MQRALDSDHTAYNDTQVDRAIAASSRSIEAGLAWQDIAPMTATRSFDWPTEQRALPWRLWLNNQGLISVTSMTSGGVTIPEPDRFLEPVNEGPPYTRVEMDLASASSFNAGATHQRSVVLVGLWGLRNDEVPAGALVSAPNSTVTTVDVTDGAVVGVGSLLRVDTERMQVTGRAWIDSTFNPTAGTGDEHADRVIAVSDGTQFHAGERILLDAEEMLVNAVAGNTLVVERAVNGSLLADHTTGADIYVSRRLTVARGAQGTTAASHLAAAPVVAWDPPPLIEALCVAASMDQVEQELGAYSREVRSGEAAALATGSGLEAAWARAIEAHGRQARQGAI